MKIFVVIPARYRSSRFPGKPLADLGGKPMIQHVYERCLQSQKASKVIVATDDLRIFNTVKNFGGTVVMTSQEHLTGTDRVIEVAEKMPADIFINVQGDEPLIRAEEIDLLIDKMVAQPSCRVATLCHPVVEKIALNPNVVKLIRSFAGQALYFSRMPIPYNSENDPNFKYLKHVGVYGYRYQVLVEYKNLPYSYLENAEKLEQLRLMEAGIAIDVLETEWTGQGVDTPEDLETVRKIMLYSSRGHQARPMATLP